MDVDQAIKLAFGKRKKPLDYDEKIVNSEGAAFNSHTGIRVYGNSYGMLQSYLSSRYSLSCSVIAGKDEQLERDYEYTISRDVKRLKKRKLGWATLC